MAQAGGSGGAKTFRFAFPLPKSLQGAIYEIDTGAQVPTGTTVTGAVGLVMLNPSSVSSARVTYVVVSFPSRTWEIFLAIAPTKSPRTSSTGIRDSSLHVAATVVGPILNQSFTISSTPTDACRELRELAGGASVGFGMSYFNMNSPSNADAKHVVAFAEKADPHCG